ncbi:hypothetical protein [Acinetobacter junii]|uniref:hypothetical protein n=1 Tax=Acinetobacter junii TaxID=40215 RepID=UPI00125F647F|nr:hypothetical protein [Acinetobacter junii]
MIVEHDFLMWIKNKQNVDRFLIFARSLMNWLVEKAHLIQIIAPQELRHEIVYRASVALERNDHGDSIVSLESLIND